MILITHYCLGFQLRSYILEEQTALFGSVELQNICGRWVIFISANFECSCLTRGILMIVSLQQCLHLCLDSDS